MAETNGKKSKLDKDWTTEEVDILINHYMSERSLWDITHSDYSKKDVRQKALAKIQESLQDKFTSKCFVLFGKVFN